MRRNTGLTLLLWGLVLAPTAYGQGSPLPDATPPRLEGAVLELPALAAPATLPLATPAALPLAAPGALPPAEPMPLAPPAIESAPEPLPVIARGQDYAPPDPVFPIPTYSTRPENGGLYLGVGFTYYQQTIPLKTQAIAVRGFTDADGSITGRVGQFVGSHNVALSSTDIGQSSYTPGFQMFAGWKFRNGATLEVDWMHFSKVKYAGGASIEPFLFAGGQNLADTFISAPVYNFPAEFAGQAQNLNVGNPGATFGIWDAATVMTIQFTQRYDQYDIGSRVPVFQTDNNRVYGLIGLRNAFLVEKFWWRTVSADINGNAGPDTVADYRNNVTNNMFGPVIGCGDEWRCGDSPLGTFAVSLDLRAGLLMDLEKHEVKYERGDRAISSKGVRRQVSLVEELQATPNLCWYPIEGVQLKVGYDIFAFFNTMSSPYPVSFNYLQLDAATAHQIRYFNGINAAFALIF